MSINFVCSKTDRSSAPVSVFQSAHHHFGRVLLLPGSVCVSSESAKTGCGIHTELHLPGEKVMFQYSELFPFDKDTHGCESDG